MLLTALLSFSLTQESAEAYWDRTKSAWWVPSGHCCWNWLYGVRPSPATGGPSIPANLMGKAKTPAELTEQQRQAIMSSGLYTPVKEVIAAPAGVKK